MFKFSKKHWNNMSNMFKVNSKYTRTTSGVFILNFEHILQFILLLLLLNLNKYSKTLASGNKVVFNNCEKYLVLLAGKIFVELHVFIFIHKHSKKLTPYLFQNYAALFFVTLLKTRKYG